MKNVAVLGAGSWGTSLAVHLARVGHDIRLWGREPEVVEAIRSDRMNHEYLPGVHVPERVTAVDTVEDALVDAQVVLTAAPSHGLRGVARQAAGSMALDAIVVSATKGLEERTLLRPSEILAQELGTERPVVALSGPSFAMEVARGLPTALLAASADQAAARAVQHEFRGSTFRIYASDDVIGVEVGAAMKNVIAIAAGAVESLGLGSNALAALITRGLAELSRLAVALGGKRETLAGLSGLGDLVLTCTGALSRNRHLGIELGKGRKLADILGETRMVAEGVRTTHAALELGARCNVELPITAKMEEVLSGKDPRVAVEELFLRPQRSEQD